MSEQTGSPETALPDGVRVELRLGQELTFRRAVLLPHDKSEEKYGIGADLLAVIELPGEAGVHKNLGIFDFGEDYAAKKIFPKMPGLGTPGARLGILGLDYEPDTHMLPYAPLGPGSLLLGREDDMDSAVRPNYGLGLTDSHNTGNRSISRRHAEIVYETEPEQRFTVRDESSNGTVLLLPKLPPPTTV